MAFNALLFASVILNVSAQFLLKAGMKRIGPVVLDQSILAKLLEMLWNGYFWAGLAAYGISLVLYSVVLSRIELGRAYPISGATAILLITVVSIVFLKEDLTVPKVAGICLCCAGIALIFR